MRLVLAALALAISPAFADTITSSVSSAASQSIGSVSDSISGSSDSSSGKGEARVAAGPYRIVALTPGGERTRLALTPLDAQGEAQGFALHLPAELVQRQQLQAGQSLHIQARAYGWAVAREAAATPFFLVLEDSARRELDSVKL